LTLLTQDGKARQIMSKQNCARLPFICQILIATPLSSLWVLEIPATITSIVGQKLAPDSAKILVVDQSISLINKHLVSIAQAQMTPAVNSTTVVTPTSPGNNQTQFNITGGDVAGDRANLFHSFRQFNLTENQIANFVTESNIKNIFTRINGGDVSLINGLIQVTGSQANLFLMNPAGIIFGPNARLNLPAAFTVTTASGIELNNQWFSTHGQNQYELLTGSPSAFVFPQIEAGVIINAGDLSVGDGHNISLLGGTVVNTGNITAPYGQVTIAAVPGENVLRISQTGKLLNLELIPGDGGFHQNLINTNTIDETELSSDLATPVNDHNINPLSLPALLTGQSEALQLATGLTVNADGQVVLTGTSQTIPHESGTAIVTGNIDVRSNTFFPYVSGVVNILGDKIGIFGSTISLSGMADAGLVRIGSDLPNNNRLYEASRTYVDDRTTISMNGEGGRVIIGSKDITSFAGRVEIESSATTSADGLDNLDSLSLANRLNPPNFDNSQNNDKNNNLVHVFSNKNLIYDGAVQTKVNNQSKTSNLGNLLLEQDNLEITDNNPYRQQNILFGDVPEVSLVSEKSLADNTGATNIFLKSRGDININDLSAQQLNLPNQQAIVHMQADSDGNGQGSLIMPTNYTLTTEGGAIALGGLDIQAGNIISRGGEVYLSASNSLEVQNINSGAGNISLIAPQAVNVREIRTSAREQAQGKITITSDEINLLGGEASITGQGEIVLETYLPTQNIEIGGSEDNNTLNLTDADLASLADGFSALTIGRADGSGNINLLNSQSFAFTDLVTIQSPAGGGTIRANTLTGQGNTALTFIADSNITLGNISGYDTVKIDSTRGAIALANISTEQGAIDLQSYDKITGGNLTAPLGINLTTDQGSIDLKNLTTTAVNNISGNVNITTNNGSARIANINTSGNLGGGQVEINTVGYLTTGEINSHSQQGNGGTVTLQTSNNIEVNTINTQGTFTTGSGGNVNITTGGSLRVTGTFTADNQVTASIATNGGEKGGAIAIQYRGAVNTFTVGDSSLNGTAGAITDGQSTIQPTRTLPSNFNLQQEADNTQSATAPEIRQDNSAIAEENKTTTEQTTAETTEQTTENSTVSRIDQNSTREIVPVDNSQEQANTEQANTESVNNQSTVPVDQERIVTPVKQVQPVNQASEKTAIANPALPASNSETINENTNNTANNTTDNSTRQVQDVINSSNTPINTNIANSNQSVNTSSIDINQSETDLAINNIETNNTNNTNNIENGSDAITSLVNNQLNSSNTNNINDLTNNASTNLIVNNQINLTEDTGNLSLTSTQTNQSNNDINNNLINNSQPIVNVDSYLPDQSVLNTETNSSSTIISSSLQAVTDIANTDQVNPVNTAVANNPNIVQTSQPVDVMGYQNRPLPEINSPQPTNYNLIQIDQVDQKRGREFSNYFGRDIASKQVNASGIRKTLSSVTHLGINSVILYVSAQNNYVELKLFLPNGKSIVKSIEVSRDTVLEVVKEFTNQVRKPTNLDNHDYLNNGKKLYDWLISPLEKELQQNNINTIIFSMDAGLRGLPLAALYDGKKFLVEKYAFSLVPSFSLTDTQYVGLKDAQVLAMGASEFPRDTAQSPLPSVPLELSNIITEIWSGESFLNQDFTLANLQAQQAKGGFQIIHLATHGEFHPGGAKNSYIQFWDRKLRIDQLRQLNLSDPQVELLVLSACTTAIGDEDAELGFAGLAVQAGVKSALASLWYVSDTGTLALMTEFYRQLKIRPLKAEALRQAQLALLYKRVRLEEGAVRSDTGRSTINLPGELAYVGDRPLSHPYYWAAFTMIGSPW
jgi:filamentous hemagglutinin family protein